MEREGGVTARQQGTGLEESERAGPSAWGNVLFAAWGFAEATLLPIVPDVGLYPVAVAFPRSALRLFLDVLVGALAGSAVLYVSTVAAPDLASELVLTVPGINQALLDSASHAVADADPTSMALVGPGTPLKVFTVAWALGPNQPVPWLAGVLVNRLTRIGPGVVVAVVLGILAPTWARRHARALLVAYVLGWVALYVVLLS